MPIINVAYQIVDKNQHHDQKNNNNHMKLKHREYEGAHKIYPQIDSYPNV